MDLKLKKQFRGETNLDVFVWDENNNVAFTEAYVNWLEKQCTIADVGNCAYLVQDKNFLINHGLFTSEEKAKKYINGNTNYAVQKCDIA
tara:strand:- start:258 stop:524 length:267 start_codon:yes stop_codon:yes gene_type:complete